MTIALGCVAVAWLLIFVPRGFVLVGQARRPEGYDNAHPRDQQAKLEGWAKRAQAAHLNAFEGFAPFAAAVLVAHVGGGDRGWADLLAIAFCVIRVVYTVLYLGNVPALRTLVWTLGAAATGALFALPLLG
jgi:uncharacterized MAPEG superfamily protein